MADFENRRELYWVVGTSTNVGKTTIASTLIEVLNESGTPCAGFKPFGAFRPRENIEFMMECYPGSNCRLFGPDAQKLTQASPLTNGNILLDVVAPSYSLFNQRIQEPILLRTGSYCLGNVEYFTTAENEKLLRRADYRRIFEKCGLPYEQAKVFNPRADDVHKLSSQKVARAFDRLLTLNPRAIVCEGAGAYLPLWPQGPLPNHLFLVTHDHVHFCRDIRFDKPIDPTRRSTVEDISTSTPMRSMPFFLMEAQGRDSKMKKIVRYLLET